MSLRCPLIAALLGFTASGIVSAREPTALPDTSAATATLIPWLLQEKDELRMIPFSDVVFQTTGKNVMPINTADETDERVLKQIGAALDQA